MSLGSPANFRRSRNVMYRVKTDPIRRSISDRAITASACRRSGARKVWQARCRSSAVNAENSARNTWRLGFTCWQVSKTSKAMASPSRSQSSHRTIQSHPRASVCSMATTSAISPRGPWRSGAVNRATGSTRLQFFMFSSNSTSNKCPRTAVTTMVTCCPRRANGNSDTCDRWVRVGLPRHKCLVISRATLGFSATLSTRTMA
mmetsp:Transcript_48061/g.108920  ORF Transcript_48061/g.108920 Transcript_48061/m.108920 type:complete len:203 (+) Transcript_48061:1324-1932(+)